MSPSDLTQKAPSDGVDQILQLHPFGHITLGDTDPAEEGGYYLLPQYEQAGYLYLGIRDLQPPQELSLLFQLVTASGNAELEPPQVNWRYLEGDRWRDFSPTDLLSDTTNGLIDSGLIRFSIPVEATVEHHLLPTGLYWFRATVSDHTAAIADTLDIKTQAMSATYANQGNAPDHLSQPLAANTIHALVQRDPAIASVTQPYSSFGGRRSEDQQAFETRVSERLRHKQRAIAAWDYEHLVLEKFPQIYKVKCLSSTAQNTNPAAAQVTIVVIPNLANTAPFLPLEPKAPLYLLKQIEDYLSNYTSPFVRLVVKNPRYKRIQYRMAIRFRKGYDQGYYLKQLNEDLKQFLSPWAYQAQADIPFGSTIHSSAVIHFIEKRSYVDYVANLKLNEQTELPGGELRIKKTLLSA